jgi:hypothetical protein
MQGETVNGDGDGKSSHTLQKRHAYDSSQWLSQNEDSRLYESLPVQKVVELSEPHKESDVEGMTISTCSSSLDGAIASSSDD